MYNSCIFTETPDMKVRHLPLFLIAISFATIHCKKEEAPALPPDQPGSVTITTPVANTLYENGFVLTVEGEMIDNNVLSTARVEVRNKTTGALLFQQSTPTGNVTFFRFLWNWTVTGMTANIVATVKITAVDFQSREVSKQVDIFLGP